MTDREAMWLDEGLTHNTIATLLGTLEKKGYVDHVEAER